MHLALPPHSGSWSWTHGWALSCADLARPVTLRCGTEAGVFPRTLDQSARPLQCDPWGHHHPYQRVPAEAGFQVLLLPSTAPLWPGCRATSWHSAGLAYGSGHQEQCPEVPWRGRPGRPCTPRGRRWDAPPAWRPSVVSVRVLGAVPTFTRTR